MKTKIMLAAAGTALAVIMTLHIGHEPPKDGQCPLAKAIQKIK